jgi:hypothetical protein
MIVQRMLYDSAPALPFVPFISSRPAFINDRVLQLSYSFPIIRSELIMAETEMAKRMPSLVALLGLVAVAVIRTARRSEFVKGLADDPKAPRAG